MTDRPLCSVVTGTWQRHDLLMGAIDAVRAQTYRPLEHCIVSDGPDPDLAQTIGMIQREAAPTDPPIRFLELGRNWSTFLTDSMSAVPFQVAQWMAAGEYLCWFADDERFLDLDHITKLVNLLESEGTDYAYSQVRFWLKGQPERHWIIGEYPPRKATVTHAVLRASLLNVPGGGFRTHVGSASDWDQFERWLANGKRGSFLPEVTFAHRADK